MTTPGPRTRVTGGFTQVAWNSYYQDVGGPLTLSGTDYFTTGREITMQDTVIENFHARRKNGEVFFNPLVLQDVAITAEPANCHFTSTATGREYTGDWNHYQYSGDFIACTDESIADLEAITANQAYGKVSSNDASLLVTLAELRTTKDMLLGVAKKIDKLRTIMYEAIRAGKALTKGSSLWLEFRYGWTPLYYEVQGLVKALEKHSYPERQSFRSARPFQDQISEDSDLWVGDVHLFWTKTASITGHVCSGVLAELRTMGHPDTLGITKLPQAIWDLTRLSFAVDWIFNVADTIAAWTPDTLWQVLGSWTTVEYVHSQTVTGWWEMNVPQTWINVSGSVYTAKKLTRLKTRSSAAQRTVLPQLAFRMNWKHYVDAVALTSKKWSKLITYIGKRRLKN